MTLYTATVCQLPKLRAEIAGIESSLAHAEVVINEATLRQHLADLKQILSQRGAQ